MNPPIWTAKIKLVAIQSSGRRTPSDQNCVAQIGDRLPVGLVHFYKIAPAWVLPIRILSASSSRSSPAPPRRRRHRLHRPPPLLEPGCPSIRSSNPRIHRRAGGNFLSTPFPSRCCNAATKGKLDGNHGSVRTGRREG
uniref:Uncharacterized protein n=1 Tax=Oryza sativa subsp. japonica TaxID=39947 RepID=Q8H5C2_ORYSJ|nr:hypothetical protein [Oryza sativa Japonica Group]BAD31475.1 hypothetical protein [Oryza sativa Japonica Group]